ncbi:hypothetical protein [Brevifollis gellanilyticus]|uniref:General secretion pathway protein GspM n=1 Tax=Brevifollis gellanilyticus TaxID=748831 RepID=A0A512M839_9BACT|nr:hypothetical protein [Brevifollis gellanilyticus]GEP42903.1 hypothetical protein BGE01nite_21940 [Brevifollis gellanilyticus]
MTASEQRLALGLGVILIGGGAFIGLNKLKTWKQHVDGHAAEVFSRRAEADDLLSRQDFWQQRSAWLAEKQPVLDTPGKAITNVIALADELASKHSIEIPIKQPNEAVERAGMSAAVVTLKVEGEMKPVMNWLLELQQPTNFVSVPAMTITPNEENPQKIEVNMRVEKWFRLPPS